MHRIDLLMAVIVVLAVGSVSYTVATSDELHDYVGDSHEWCEAHAGELYNAQVVGSHGGLHCELPNGTTVHMSEVVD